MVNCESNNVSKIFAMIVNKFNRKDELIRTIIYDFYVRKILELMIGKNDFYIQSLTNLKHVDDHELLMLTSNEVYLDIRKYVEQSFVIDLNNIGEKLHQFNRDYFDYSLIYENYLEGVIGIFKSLKNQH